MMDIRKAATNVQLQNTIQAESVKNQLAPSTNNGSNLTVNAVSGVDSSNDVKNAEENKQKSPLDKDVLKQSVEDTNKALAMMSTSLELSIDDQSDEVVTKVIDKDTNKVIRQIPSEEMIELAKRVEEFKSILTSQKA
ncbi:flagellar protein FlaG [Leeia sp. TBRC 13508]|uniref:Flagellar protein FlaG n=1 Tax=Leeia speluncae TaxID=2884804 RepID=A0ABS8D226_9NEIS|nr:flagellar protein FlaG [Leeia speluncae]MCB6182240.1 flagellar protein FlaG [Leeia speluncae]